MVSKHKSIQDCVSWSSTHSRDISQKLPRLFKRITMLTLKRLSRAQLCNSPVCPDIKTTHFSFCKMQVDAGYYSAPAVKAPSTRPPTQCVYVKYTRKISTRCKSRRLAPSTQTICDQYSLKTHAANPYVYDPEILLL